jgi:hypothetical protein
MTEVAGTKFAGKAEPALMPHDAQKGTQVLETALRRIAEQPSDDPGTLQQFAATALQNQCRLLAATLHVVGSLQLDVGGRR